MAHMLWGKEYHEKNARKWEKDHVRCRNYLLNCLSDNLCDYDDQTYAATKKIREALQQKYDTEEGRSKKYSYCRYFIFQMVENKSIIEQARDLEMLAHDV